MNGAGNAGGKAWKHTHVTKDEIRHGYCTLIRTNWTRRHTPNTRGLVRYWVRQLRKLDNW